MWRSFVITESRADEGSGGLLGGRMWAGEWPHSCCHQTRWRYPHRRDIPWRHRVWILCGQHCSESELKLVWLKYIFTVDLVLGYIWKESEGVSVWAPWFIQQFQQAVLVWGAYQACRRGHSATDRSGTSLRERQYYYIIIISFCTVSVTVWKYSFYLVLSIEMYEHWFQHFKNLCKFIKLIERIKINHKILKIIEHIIAALLLLLLKIAIFTIGNNKIATEY